MQKSPESRKQRFFKNKMKGKKSNSFISNVNFFITSFVKYLTLKLRPFGSQKKSVLIGCVLLFLIYYFFFKSTNPGLTSIISCKRDLAKVNKTRLNLINI